MSYISDDDATRLRKRARIARSDHHQYDSGRQVSGNKVVKCEPEAIIHSDRVVVVLTMWDSGIGRCGDSGGGVAVGSVPCCTADSAAGEYDEAVTAWMPMICAVSRALMYAAAKERDTARSRPTGAIVLTRS